MSDAKQMLFSKNLMNICIDGCENADYQGKLWHQYSDSPIEFLGMVNLMEIMDGLMDEWGFPQKGVKQRSFYNADRNKNEVGYDEESRIDQIRKKNGVSNIQNKRGKLGSYVVQVSFRQNATWQGHVVCTNTNVKRDFSSEMELLKIIHNDVKGIEIEKLLF